MSHDRYFINRFAQRIWSIQDGRIQDYKGTFEAYKTYLDRQAQFAKSAPVDVGKTTPEPPKPAKPKRPGGTKYLEKEVAAAERAVAKAEEEMDELSLAIEDAASDYLKLQELYQQREELDDKIRHLYTQWEKLAQELEEAQG